MDKLFIKLNVCSELIAKGQTGNIVWLNKFCAAFHKFASKFKIYLPHVAPKYELEGNIKLHVETIYLCFTQVITCITQLERTLSVENTLGKGVHLRLSRTHFLDRIEWCLRRLQASLYQLSEEAICSTGVKLDDLSFVELLDLALTKLETYNEIVQDEDSKSLLDDENPQLCIEINHIVRHALAFANVALETDKKALTEICETVLDECAIFERNFEKHNLGERKLEACSLQRALYSLETYLNEALLRLIFSSLIDAEKTSVNTLKNVLQKCENPKEVDKLIVEFDTNMDRIQQIGVFAIAFTPDVKTKTIIRSCLASLESLDSCIVPAFQLQTSTPSLHYADILARHFKEELGIFRNVIHQIINSRALIDTYLDMLAESIDNAEKFYPQGRLLKVAQMGNVLFQHFHLKVNYQELCYDECGKRLHQDFVIILGESQAVLELKVQVDLKRVIKRLKILYSVLAKLRDVCDKRITQGSVCNNENSQMVSRKLKSLSIRQQTFAKPVEEFSDVHKNTNKSLDLLSHESDLISFQVTEILRIN